MLLALPGSIAAPSLAAVFTNPIVEASPRTGSADPSVVLHRGYYYYCRSIGNGQIGIAKARRLQDIGAAPMRVVFQPPLGTPYSKRLWAPKLQQLGRRWYIYFAASDGPDPNHRMYVLQSSGSDPDGPYVFKGRVTDTTDAWAIDGVALTVAGKLYFVWSGWPEGADHFPQLLYIAAMRDPLTIVGTRHVIAGPEHEWERSVKPLVEAPQPLYRDGHTFIVYSANASWSDDSALGLLTYAGGDPLQATAWEKHPRPVFGKNATAGVFSVGHATFVTSPDGREDWMLYHAIEASGAGWAGRAVRAQPFHWSRDGMPVFGTAIAHGCLLHEPSGTPAVRSVGPGEGASRNRETKQTLAAAPACAN